MSLIPFHYPVVGLWIFSGTNSTPCGVEQWKPAQS